MKIISCIVIVLSPIALMSQGLSQDVSHLGNFAQNDTWATQATLNQGTTAAWLGLPSALSVDGNTLAVGNPAFSRAGVTQIFVRSSGVWSKQATLSQDVPNSWEGSSIGLSADGNTLAAGAWNSNQSTGQTFIYIRTGTSWQLQAVVTRSIKNSSEGSAVSLSADGNTLAVGAPGLKKNSGAVHIYIRSGTAWSYQETVSQGIANSGEGASVSLSADATTLATGAPGSYGANFAGLTHIYDKLGTSWQYQATLSQGITNSLEGAAISLSADGTTLAAGAIGFNVTNGATQIYSLANNTWLYQTTLSQNADNSHEGTAVALSGDGDILAVGAPAFNNLVGATQLYIRSGISWSYAATLSQGIANGLEGTSISLANNNTLAAGIPTNINVGETIVYVQN